MRLPAPGDEARSQWAPALGMVVALVLMAAALFASPIVLALLAVVLGGAVIVRSPRDTVTVLVVFLFLQILIPAPLVVGSLGSVGRPALLAGMASLVIVGWTLLASPALRVRRRVGAVWAVVGLFFSSALMSFVSAYVRHPVAIELRALNRWMLFVLSLCGIALLAADGIESRERLAVLLRRLVNFVAISAVVGILQFATDIDLARMIRFPGLAMNTEFVAESRSLFTRTVGTALHPIEFSVVLAMTLPFAVHFAVFDPGRRRWPAYLQAAVIAAAVPMAISRSGVLCLVVALATVVVTWPWRQQLRAVVVGVLFLGLMRGAVPGLLGTIRALFTGVATDPSTTGRTEDYAVIGDYVSQNPWFGRGGYTFIPTLYRTLDNQFLLTLVDSGIVGLIAVIALFVTAIALARGARRRLADDPVGRNLAQSIVGSLVGAMITFATFDAWSFPTMSAFVFLLLGIAGAYWRLSDPGAEQEDLLSADVPRSGVREAWTQPYRPSVTAGAKTTS